MSVQCVIMHCTNSTRYCIACFGQATASVRWNLQHVMQERSECIARTHSTHSFTRNTLRTVDRSHSHSHIPTILLALDGLLDSHRRSASIAVCICMNRSRCFQRWRRCISMSAALLADENLQRTTKVSKLISLFSSRIRKDARDRSRSMLKPGHVQAWTKDAGQLELKVH